ncbi:ATP-binding protein [Phaeovulum sp. NW3]|uniref:ATP-binding protein n=1 Tax=Phaeovulum sp. NW3 TaxID=2934933 RepID=UPI002020DAD7|nr:ATP-binding protein [Phaeovulum sp. NW3]MCL7466668.1 ATP-binding protein [Phaeovulum sp. NW3]
MNFDWLKRLMPRGLYGRAALILILPVVTIQLVVSVVFLQRHFEGVTEQMTATMLRELAYVAARAEAAPDPVAAVAAVAAVAGPLDLGVALPAPGPAQDPDPASSADQRVFYDLSGRVVIETLRAGLPGLGEVDLSNLREVRLTLNTRHGPMELRFDRRRVSATNPHQLIVLMLGTGLLMTLVAFLFLRNQLRPIRRLAIAAEAFGKGRALPYRPAGAQEVRAAGTAFLEMRARIERQIEQRTLMLSGISHDLRTPLTRLRLGLSMLPDDPETRDEVAAMERDVAEMGRLVDAFLDFARDEATAGEPERIDPCAFVAHVVEDARRAGQPVSLTECPGPGLALITVRPDALRRALENLFGNAVRYGTRAEVSVTLGPRSCRIVVEDDGPGIPADRREEALRPFTRLDPARNQNRGQGVGLGLSIAADILRGHGGSLRLGDSARLGGLRVELVLPL